MTEAAITWWHSLHEWALHQSGYIVTMRKRLEMGGMSYGQDEQQSSQLSLSFDFIIQCNKYHMSPNKSMAVPRKLTVREDRKMHNLCQ